MIRTIILFVISAPLICFADLPNASDRAPIEELVDSFIANTKTGAAIYPTKWSKDLKAEEIDLNKLIHADYEAGRPYGATASQNLKIPFDVVEKAVSQKGAVMNLVTKVKTLRNSEKILTTPADNDQEFCMKTDINVPVVADFRTHVRIHLFKPSESKGVLEWRQIDETGELTYNQGAMVIEPGENNTTNVSAIGIHVINQKNKVPWLGRSTARAFAKTHYGNFISALKELSISK